MATNTIDIAHAENVAPRLLACALQQSCELVLITMSPRRRFRAQAANVGGACSLLD